MDGQSRRGRAPAVEASSTVSLRAAVASGLGVGVLPCHVGDALPGVTRIEMGPAAPRGHHLITHPTQSKLARSRAVADFLVKFIARNRDMFSGVETSLSGGCSAG